MESVFNEEQQRAFQQQNPLERPCRNFHGIQGRVPGPHELNLDQITCDCGKFLFYVEPCTCPNSPGGKLRTKENPNYGG